MRSRYCAFVLGLGAYLQDTWHASTRPGTEPSFEPGQKWLRLEVKRAPTPGVGADPSADSTAATGEVEFVAVSKFGGKAMRLHERSRFVLDAGRWLYVDGHVQ